MRATYLILNFLVATTNKSKKKPVMLILLIYFSQPNTFNISPSQHVLKHKKIINSLLCFSSQVFKIRRVFFTRNIFQFGLTTFQGSRVPWASGHLPGQRRSSSSRSLVSKYLTRGPSFILFMGGGGRDGKNTQLLINSTN